MKIVNRLEFMKLPSGTLYKKFPEPFAFGDLSVKFDSLTHHDARNGDFVCMEFGDIEAGDSGQMFDRLFQMMDAGASYPLSLDCAGRDGMFEPDAMFLVYERDDVIKLRDFIASLVTD